MSGKIWIGGVSFLAALAAAGAGLVCWEGRVWDEKVREFAANPPAGMKVVYEETGRTWRSRTFRVRAEAAGGLTALWRGHASMGWGTHTSLSLELTEGVGLALAGKGIEGYRDAMTVETSVTGAVKPLVWRIDPLTIKDRETGGVCRTEPLVIEAYEAAGRASVTAGLEGIVCRSPEDAETANLKGLAFGMTFTEGKPLADLTVSGGAFSAEGLTGEGFSLTLTSERMARKSGAEPEQNAGEKAVRWEERVAVSVEKPRAESDSADRVGFTLRITNLTEDFINAATGAAADPAAALGVVALWGGAFMKDGLAVELDEAQYVRGKERAVLTGRLAYAEDLKTGIPRWGAFSLTIPQDLIAPATIAEPLSRGQLKLVDGAYRAYVELTAGGIFSNNVPVAGPGVYQLLR